MTAPVLREVRTGDGPAVRALRLQALADTPIAYSRPLAEEAAWPDEVWAGRAAHGVDAVRGTWVLDADDRLLQMVRPLT